MSCHMTYEQNRTCWTCYVTCFMLCYITRVMLCYITWDQFSFLGNRSRYEFIELDMSTVLALSIPSSRPLTFPGGQSKNSYRARWLIELGDLSSSVFQEKKKREKMEIKAIITTWSTKSKTPSRSQFLTDKKHCVAGRLKLFWRRVF